MPRLERWTWVLLLSVAIVPANAAHAQRGLRKGPWVMDVRPTSAVLLVELRDEGDVEVELDVGADRPAVSVSRGRTLHRVALRGLTPNERYRYVVRSGDARASGSFRTAPPDGEGPLRFVIYGDTRTQAEQHGLVARQVLNRDPQLAIHTGDLVATGSLDDDWQQFFRIERDLLMAVPLYPVIGNHELQRDDAEGLERYLRYLAVPADGRRYYAFTWGPVRFVMLDSNDEWEQGGEQWAWLERELVATAADPSSAHVVAVMHHGPFSSGYHGPNQRMLRAGVPALLREHGVDLVVGGHDHTYQRGTRDGLRYLVSGGGGAPLYVMNRQSPGLLAFAVDYHVVDVEVTEERFAIHALRADGTTLERCWFSGDSDWRCLGDSPEAPGAGPMGGIAPWRYWASRYKWWWITALALLIGWSWYWLWKRDQPYRRRPI